MVVVSRQVESTKISSARKSSGATEFRDLGATEPSGSTVMKCRLSRRTKIEELQNEELVIAANTEGSHQAEADGITQIDRRKRPRRYTTGDGRILKLLSPQRLHSAGYGEDMQQGNFMILTAIISDVNNSVEVKVYELSGKEKIHHFPMQGRVSDLIGSIREDGYQDKDIRAFASSDALTSRCDDNSGVFTRLHTLSTLTIRIRSITVMRAFTRPIHELYLFYIGVQAGFDGSLLENGDMAMVVRPPRMLHDWTESQRRGVPLAPVVRIDYFYNVIDGVPVCRIDFLYESVSAVEMIHMTYGFTAFRIRNIQRRWRRWRRDNRSDINSNGEEEEGSWERATNISARETTQECFSSTEAREPMHQ